MALLVNSGRAGLAAALKARPLHFAWGRGASWWGQSVVQNKTFAGTPERITLDHAPVASLVLRDENGIQVFNAPEDYTYDLNAGIITRTYSGQIDPGATVQVELTYGVPNVTADEPALLDEVGRRVAASKEFVTPDPQGSISTPGGARWSLSAAPTRYLYVTCLFDFLEAADEAIRELGIFVDTVIAGGVPQGRLYLTPSDVADAGYLMLLDRFPAIQRSPTARQGFSYVLVI